MAHLLLAIAAAAQGLAVLYGFYLLSRRQGAAGAWSFLLGAMLSMLAWRIVVVLGLQQPPYFNPIIAIWGSTCMLFAMFLFGREVERRKRLEAERDALFASERAARADAERASRMKDDFLATVSHELRTPLAAILSWCEVARHVRTSVEDKHRAIDTIERNARVQARLVDDLLDLTRLRAGALFLERSIVSLEAPVGAALLAVRPSAAAKSINVEFECEGETPIVEGDAGRLEQIATNLLVNAVKFTPKGGRIQVFIHTRLRDVDLVIRDDGEGFESDFEPHLFARFRQADSTTARRHGGLGLGLSIVSSLVRLHGGDVRAASPGPGKGATFTVTLPRARAVSSAGEAAPAAADSEANLSRALTGVRLLVIDDERDFREALAALLERSGASVVTLDGSRTLETALWEFKPHVLLMDISMPVEDGYASIARVRRLPVERGGRTPAISLTAHARNEDRARALAAGFQNHLPKPIDYPSLVEAVRQLAAA